MAATPLDREQATGNKAIKQGNRRSQLRAVCCAMTEYQFDVQMLAPAAPLGYVIINYEKEKVDTTNGAGLQLKATSARISRFLDEAAQDAD